MAERIEELKKDIAELEEIEKVAKRKSVKDLISLNIRRLVSEHVKLLDEFKDNIPNAKTPVATSSKRYQVKINNYAWDQSDKFVKFYVTFQNVHDIPAENVECKFTSKSLALQVMDLEKKDYIFTINNLLYPIDAEKSHLKIKKDTVVLFCAKTDTQRWSHVTELEKKASDAKNFNPKNTEGNPEDNIMSLMKNLYDQGDDEMKRTIAKAWTENQEKKLPQM